ARLRHCQCGDRRGCHLDCYVREALAVTGCQRACERICRGCIWLRRYLLECAVASHLAEFTLGGARACSVAAGLGDLADFHPWVSRVRCSAADPRVGSADCGGP